MGLLAAFGALVLWLELLMREAAVYVVVLMLPLAFAAMVWPARRVWAIRAVELLVALILSKFAIVAVLTLGGAALGQSPFGGISSMLAGGRARDARGVRAVGDDPPAPARRAGEQRRRQPSAVSPGRPAERSPRRATPPRGSAAG